MGKGGDKPQVVKSADSTGRLTWEEVRKHNARDDSWLVINGNVYDVTRWFPHHPGGAKMLRHYVGQDATEAFKAFHIDTIKTSKYMKPLLVGPLADATAIQSQVKDDFEELRCTAEKMGLFKPSVIFFFLSLLHVICLEIAAYLILRYFGTSWLPWIASMICYVIVQAQTGYNQHDFGHLSVFSSSKWNHWIQCFAFNHTKGAPRSWWNHLHFQHHAKPNVIGKDPDVNLDKVFVVGDTMSKTVAETRKKSMPYNHQHKYFFIIGPPMLFPVYFQVMIFYHVISRKSWNDLLWTLSFYVKFFLLYTPLLGFGGAIFYYFTMRVLESSWFVWVTQSNHIPMEIDVDKERPWLPLQLAATCNVEKSAFNDWFTGHLNFQIEHHLFPTMPRHNYYKIAPLVKSLCEKYQIQYIEKSLYQAFADIVRSLKHSGELWKAYYEAYHLS